MSRAFVPLSDSPGTPHLAPPVAVYLTRQGRLDFLERHYTTEAELAAALRQPEPDVRAWRAGELAALGRRLERKADALADFLEEAQAHCRQPLELGFWTLCPNYLLVYRLAEERGRDQPSFGGVEPALVIHQFPEHLALLQEALADDFRAFPGSPLASAGHRAALERHGCRIDARLGLIAPDGGAAVLGDQPYFTRSPRVHGLSLALQRAQGLG